MPTGARYRPSPGHSWIRSNILGLIAIFIALNGTAVAVQTASKGDSRTVKAKKAAKGKSKRGPAGPQGPAGPAGPQGIQGAQGPSGVGGPPSGTAGGELAGTYPNPTIGTVDGLQLATSASTTPGITFGPGGAEMYNIVGNGSLAIEAPGTLSVFGGANLTGDVSLSNATSAADAMQFGTTTPSNLYRSAADTLHTDDSFDADGSLTTDGDATLGNAAADTVTLNGGPVNIPNATSAADALILGADVNLYRSAADTLRTDDALSIGGGPISAPSATSAAQGLVLGGDADLYRGAANRLQTDDDLRLDGQLILNDLGTGDIVPPAGTATLVLGCFGGVPQVVIRWPDGVEVDPLASDSGESC